MVSVYLRIRLLLATNRYFCAAKLTKHIYNHPVLKKKILNILKYTLFTALGIFLFWLVYRGQDFSNIWYTLKNKVDYSWVFVAIVLGILSHISRALRWVIALEPLGERPRKLNSFIAVIISYFMNLLLPRMGEFARCVVLSKYEKIAFPKLLGTVLTERIMDLLMLGLMTIIVLIADFDRFIAFGQQNPMIIEKIRALLTSPYLWITFMLAIAGFFVYLKWSGRKGGTNKVLTLFRGFIDGIKSVRSIKRYKAYIAHSVFIWLMYYLMLYSIFFSFDFTRGLGPLAGLTTFVLSSFAMVAPVQGGIGAWHFMAEKGLGLYGIESANAKIFALLAHTNTQLIIIVFGVISIIVLPILNRNYHPGKNSGGTSPENDS